METKCTHPADSRNTVILSSAGPADHPGEERVERTTCRDCGRSWSVCHPQKRW